MKLLLVEGQTRSFVPCRDAGREEAVAGMSNYPMRLARPMITCKGRFEKGIQRKKSTGKLNALQKYQGNQKEKPDP